MGLHWYTCPFQLCTCLCPFSFSLPSGVSGKGASSLLRQTSPSDGDRGLLPPASAPPPVTIDTSRPTARCRLFQFSFRYHKPVTEIVPPRSPPILMPGGHGSPFLLMAMVSVTQRSCTATSLSPTHWFYGLSGVLFHRSKEGAHQGSVPNALQMCFKSLSASLLLPARKIT